MRELLKEANRPLPQMVTTEGDPIEFCGVRFEVLDQNRLSQALHGVPSLACVDENTFRWLDAQGTGIGAPDSRRTLGTLTVRGTQLIAEVMSRPRADRIQQLVDDIAGSAVRFKIASVESLESALEQHRSSPTSHQERDPEFGEIEQRWKEDYYRRWLDMPIPALGDRTPRRAARLKTVRPKLIALIKQMQLHEDRTAQTRGSRYDFAWMFEELGLNVGL